MLFKARRGCLEKEKVGGLCGQGEECSNAVVGAVVIMDEFLQVEGAPADSQ